MINKGVNTYHEIISQADIWEKTFEQLKRLDVSNWPKSNNFDQLIFTGCGSTYYLSIWGARVAQELKQLKVCPIPASEMLISKNSWYVKGRKNLVLAISRSGTTSETVAALNAFNKDGDGNSFAITCYPRTSLPQITENSIELFNAQEESIAQTRSFTNMMLGVAFFIDQSVPKYLPKQLSNQLRQLFIKYQEQIMSLGKNKNIEKFFFLGSGARYGLACEAMLKMKEMSISYSEAYHFMEFRHGPMSMVDDKSLVIGLVGKNKPEYEINVLKDMQELGAQILALGQNEEIQKNEWIDYPIEIDLKNLGIYGDVLYLPLLQLLAYERSMAKGLNPDKPNNLDAVVYLDSIS